MLIRLRLSWISIVPLVLVFACSASADQRPPNIILMVCDNLGYGDIEPFNPETVHRTPNLNRMASEGRRFTHFYSTSGVCTPSRSSIMTGAYPRRINMDLTDGRVLRPVSSIGLHPAVGTALSGGPPHRSVREELPHTALTLSRA